MRSDSYKLGHMVQSKPGTNKVYSYLTARSDKNFDKVVFFGLQYFLKEYLSKPLTMDMAEDFLAYHARILGPALPEVETKIRALCKLGYWPLKIKAVPEGTVLPPKHLLMSITNTIDGYGWCVGFIESLILKVWYPITVASCSFKYRQLVDRLFDKTVDKDQMGLKPFMVHDFGYRGDSSEEGAAISGAAHLLNFTGSDTIIALPFIDEYYNGIPSKDTGIRRWNTEPIMLSVPASEHSVMCSFGRENELDAFNHMLDLYPTGIVSIVSDTFNIYTVCTDFMDKLYDRVVSRDGKVVVRPDCYDEETQILTPRGWVYFKDLTDNDTVAQVHSDNTFDFVKPGKIVNEQYEGDMYHFSDTKGKVDLLVTPNHRMVFTKKNEVWIQSAEDAKFYYKKKAYRTATYKKVGKKLTDLERLKIAFQADGSFTSTGNKIRFSFSKQRKIDRLESILTRLGIEYKIYNLTDGRFEFKIDINGDIFVKDFSWVNIQDLYSDWCAEFIEEMSYWDATRRSDNRFKFDTTNKPVMDVVELIAIHAGYGILLSQNKDNRKDIFSDVYTAHILKDNLIGTQAFTKQKVDFKGRVYCVTVPTGMVLVKRNRATMVSGNSGDPEKVLCGDPDAEIGSKESKGVIRLLDEKFGSTINKKGYKVLNPKIGVIYGDGMYYERYEKIQNRLIEMGYAASNLVIGVGGILRNWSRDALGFAIKSTYIEVDGVGQEIMKDPVTDHGKKSHKGLMKLDYDELEHKYTTLDQVTPLQEAEGLLDTVFLDGIIPKMYIFDSCRKNVSYALDK